MREITTKIYQFDELSDEAKETARDWYKGLVFSDSSDWEHVYEDAKQCASLIGIEINKIYFSGFSSQGDGACFEGSYKYQKGAAKAIRGHAPQDVELYRIADELQKLQSTYFYRLSATTKQRGHYSHSGCMSVDVDYSGDDSRELPEEELTQLLRDFADWIYGRLEREYDFQMSDETVDDNICANEYEFTEKGKRV